MSQSNLQVLIHAGELRCILKAIERSPSTKFVGGCLFGLWRNSLKQPVIQFVTGPGKDRRSVKEMFQNKDTKQFADILWDQHRLLHLGFWFRSLHDQHQQEAINSWSNLKRSDSSGYNVLLQIKVTDNGGKIELSSGEYLLKNDNMDEKSKLFKEDVLPGESSFRLYERLTSKINDNLERSSGIPDRDELVLFLPSRVEVEEAVTNENQWYSSDAGMNLLQKLIAYFAEVGIEVGMSRDAYTHNFQFDIAGGNCLDFPANFPEKMPVLRSRNGEVFQMSPGVSNEDICIHVVNMVRGLLHDSQSSGGGKRGGKRY